MECTVSKAAEKRFMAVNSLLFYSTYRLIALYVLGADIYPRTLEGRWNNEWINSPADILRRQTKKDEVGLLRSFLLELDVA